MDPSASAYKDWFHLNFADPRSGAVGLINVSLHGSPWDERSRAIGAVLVHSPDYGWKSHIEIESCSEAYLATHAIGLRDVGLAIDEKTGKIHLSSFGASTPFHARLLAEPVTSAIDFEEKMPLGNGWVSWRLVPSINLSGDFTSNGSRSILNNAPAYHDRNWGRFYWGDDFGWEWGCFLRDSTNSQSPNLVFARTTDRAHSRHGKPFLVADSGVARRRFSPESIHISFGGNFESPVHRVPGALAVLHQDMAEPWLPRTVEINAVQGTDHVRIAFVTRAVAQLVTADPIVRGYGYIHEIVGEYAGSGRLCGIPFKSRGYAMFEYLT